MQPLARDACSVEAYGVWQGPLGEVAGLRRLPAGVPPRSGAVAALKQAEDQTVAGLAALIAAVDSAGWAGRSFADWGVVAAPRLAGRPAAAVCLDRFARQGPAGVSPLAIPTLSLHAPSGTLSMVLGIHGPNFGIGGGLGHLGEGLLVALGLLHDGLAPGVWLCLTGCDPEPEPDERGQFADDARMFAVAFALVPGDTLQALFRLRYRPGRDRQGPGRIADLVGHLQRRPGVPWACGLPGGGMVRLEDAVGARCLAG
jgi:hypothetical protein